MKTLLTTLVVAALFVALVFGIQKMLRNTLSVPLVYIPTDSVVYGKGGGIDVSKCVILAIQNPNGHWLRSSKWPAVLKGRFETTFVAPEWVPPYVDQPHLLSSK